MELYAVDVPGADSAAELAAVFRDSEHICVTAALKMVGVQEVEPGVVFELAKQPAGAARLYIVPSHVRKPRLMAEAVRVEYAHTPFDPPQAGSTPLVARGG